MTNRAVLIACCAILSGCAAHRSGTANVRAADGTYKVALRTSTLVLDGSLTVAQGAANLTFDRTSCQPQTPSLSPLNWQFDCGDVGDFANLLIGINRDDPVNRSRWSARTLKANAEKVCVRSTITATGSTVCQQWRSANNTDRVASNGALIVIRR